MPLWVLLTYAYLVGSAFAACAGSLIEMQAGEAAGLRSPFVSSQNIARSLALMLAAGPYLMLAELKQANREGRLTKSTAVTGLVFVSFWALASGILLVELMAKVRDLFH
jgi:Mn2+/Fe2+ NRAMP family transporter